MPKAPKQSKFRINNKGYYSIPRAKQAGAIDRIEELKTKKNLISLIQENYDAVQLTEIPYLYLEKYNRALEYMGRLSNVITNEFPDCLCVVNSLVKLDPKFQTNVHVNRQVITVYVDTDDDGANDMEINGEESEKDNVGVGETIIVDSDTEELGSDITEINALQEKQTAILKMADLSSLQFDILKAIFIANPHHRDWSFLLD